MRFDWLTFGLQIINFAVLVWLLRRFLYRPLLDLIDARKAEVRNQFDEASAAKAEAEKLLERTKSDRMAIAGEREQALKAALTQADEMVQARRDKAEHDAAALLDGARRTLAAEREAALAEAQRAALDLGADVARRLLAEIPVKLRAEAWLEHIEQYIAALPKEELDGLMGQLDGRAALNVVTASALPEEVAAIWRERLRLPFGDAVVITFDVNPELVAGAELYFPTAVLSFSVRSELAALRTEIESKQHDNHRTESSHGASGR
jgi:F-type H+-transporting ATPase subunit b